MRCRGVWLWLISLCFTSLSSTGAVACPTPIDSARIDEWSRTAGKATFQRPVKPSAWACWKSRWGLGGLSRDAQRCRHQTSRILEDVMGTLDVSVLFESLCRACGRAPTSSWVRLSCEAVEAIHAQVGWAFEGHHFQYETGGPSDFVMIRTASGYEMACLTHGAGPGHPWRRSLDHTLPSPHSDLMRLGATDAGLLTLASPCEIPGVSPDAHIVFLAPSIALLVFLLTTLWTGWCPPWRTSAGAGAAAVGLVLLGGVASARVELMVHFATLGLVGLATLAGCWLSWCLRGLGCLRDPGIPDLIPVKDGLVETESWDDRTASLSRSSAQGALGRFQSGARRTLVACALTSLAAGTCVWHWGGQVVGWNGAGLVPTGLLSILCLGHVLALRDTWWIADLEALTLESRPLVAVGSAVGVWALVGLPTLGPQATAVAMGAAATGATLAMLRFEFAVAAALEAGCARASGGIPTPERAAATPREVDVLMLTFRQIPTPRRGHCPGCGSPGRRGPWVACLRCETPHHGDCWTYVGGCSIYGCGVQGTSTADGVVRGDQPQGSARRDKSKSP